MILSGTMLFNDQPKPLPGADTAAERGVHAASIYELKGGFVSDSTLLTIGPVKRRERRAPAATQRHGYGL